MPRRERDREIARRRKKDKERRKLRSKGLLPPIGTVDIPKEVEKKKTKKEAPKEGPPETTKEASDPTKAEE